MTRYARLFSPLRIGPLTLSNRIVLPGLTSNFATEEGAVTDQLVDFIGARAGGGAGLVSVEGAFVDWSGKGTPLQLGIHDDRLIPGLARLAGAIRAGGAASMIQLVHTGRQMTSRWSGMPVVAPSAVPCPVTGEVPHELTVAEIRDLVERFAQAAARARAAGFDAVEFHAAHGYLMAGFLSPYSNRRQDLYGGDLRGRARFVLDVLARARELVGREYPLSLRINAEEYVAGGVTPPLAADLAGLLQAHGADMISVSVGVKESYQHTSAPAGEPPGYLAELAARIRQGTSLPVVTAGRFLTAEQAEQVLAEEKADLVCMGRALIADPDLPRKSLAGAEASIIPCIGCNACNQRTRRPQIICPVNGEAGREGEPVQASQRPRRVLVLGASLSGLEAARLAARRGDQVTVWEPRPYLGGLMTGLRVQIPGLAEFRSAPEYWRGVLAAGGVQFITGRAADLPALAEMRPDILVYALPGTPVEFAEPELEVPAPLRDRVTTAHSLLSEGEAPPGAYVVAGGGLQACEAALWLAGRGCPVTVVTRRERLIPDAHPSVRAFLLQRLKEAGVPILPGLTWTHLSPGVLALRTDTDAVTLLWDRLILENGYAYQEEQLEPYRALAPAFHLAGDEYEASEQAERVWQIGTWFRTAPQA